VRAGFMLHTDGQRNASIRHNIVGRSDVRFKTASRSKHEPQQVSK